MMTKDRLSELIFLHNSLAYLGPEELLKLTITSYNRNQEINHNIQSLSISYTSGPPITKNVVICSSYDLSGVDQQQVYMETVTRVCGIDICRVRIPRDRVGNLSQSHRTECDHISSPFVTVMNPDYILNATLSLHNNKYAGRLDKVRK